MKIFAPLCLCLVLFLTTASALAERISFNGDAHSQARLETKLLATDAPLASVRVDLTVPSIDIDRNRDGFDELSMKGLVPMGQAGKPGLLTTGALIAIPDGYKATLKVIRQKQRELPNVFVAPHQRKYRCSSAKANSFAFDSKLYESKGLFPSQLVALKEVGKLQDLRLARVAINPIQMDMGNRTLKVTTNLSLRIDFTRTGANASPVRLSKSFYRIARAIAANGQALATTVTPRMGAEVMLIFVADEFQDGLSSLVKWQQTKGLNVKVVSLTEAGGTKETVKEYIQNYYDNEAVKPSYLVFVGNPDNMPPFMEYTGSGSAATDYPFSLLSGDDDIPDVLYGRILADTLEEVQLQVSRWIDYEKSPVSGAEWYAKGLTIASDEGYNPSDAEYAARVAKSLTDHTYVHVDPLLQGESTATPANIQEALNEGRTWIAYFGHGSGTSWGSTNGSYGISDVEALTNNQGNLPVIIDVACANASWVNIDRCFGKAWVTHTADNQNAGAVAFYGGSVNISWHPPAIMSEGIAKYHFEKPVHTLGGSVLAGQLYLIEKQGVSSSTIDNLTWYNLFGDPSMLVRTATPKAYLVKQLVENQADSVTVMVKANDLAGLGVAALRVALNVPGKGPLAVSHTNDQGEATLLISGISQLEPNTVLTVTGYNAETHQIVLKDASIGS